MLQRWDIHMKQLTLFDGFNVNFRRANDYFWNLLSACGLFGDG